MKAVSFPDPVAIPVCRVACSTREDIDSMEVSGVSGVLAAAVGVEPGPEGIHRLKSATVTARCAESTVTMGTPDECDRADMALSIIFPVCITRLGIYI